MSQEESLKPLSHWLTCTKHLISLGFTVQEIEEAIKASKTTLRDLTETQYVEQDKNHSYFDDSEYYELMDSNTTGYFTEYKIIEGKEFKREYTAKAISYRTFAQYQGLKHPAILRALFAKRFSWFNKFTWEIYELRGVEYAEFYLKTSKGSLYVPIKAIMESNFDMIKKRMLTYYGWYRSGKNLRKEDSQYTMNRLKREDGSYETLKEYNKRQLGYYQKEIAPLESREAKELEAILK